MVYTNVEYGYAGVQATRQDQDVARQANRVLQVTGNKRQRRQRLS
jgi:hypothetical protein